MVISYKIAQYSVLEKYIIDNCNNKFFMDEYKNLDNLIYNSIKDEMSCFCRKICKLKTENTNLKTEINNLNNKIFSLKQEIEFYKRNISSNNLCILCDDNPREYTNIKCGHLCVCKNCSIRCENKCPICKNEGPFSRIYIS